jgi:IS5 family transposase
MAREKLNSKVVFGQKIQASLTNGCTCLHIISWDAFSESPSMMYCPERHNNLFGYYPKKVFADRAYCTRENRQKLKDLRISLAAKPLGSPKAGADHGRRGQLS